MEIKEFIKIKPYIELVELTEWIDLFKGYADNIYITKKMLRAIADKELIIKKNWSNCLAVVDPTDDYCEVITIPKIFVQSYITRTETPSSIDNFNIKR